MRAPSAQARAELVRLLQWSETRSVEAVLAALKGSAQNISPEEIAELCSTLGAHCVRDVFPLPPEPEELEGYLRRVLSGWGEEWEALFHDACAQIVQASSAGGVLETTTPALQHGALMIAAAWMRASCQLPEELARELVYEEVEPPVHPDPREWQLTAHSALARELRDQLGGLPSYDEGEVALGSHRLRVRLLGVDIETPLPLMQVELELWSGEGGGKVQCTSLARGRGSHWREGVQAGLARWASEVLPVLLAPFQVGSGFEGVRVDTARGVEGDVLARAYATCTLHDSAAAGAGRLRDWCDTHLGEIALPEGAEPDPRPLVLVQLRFGTRDTGAWARVHIEGERSGDHEEALLRLGWPREVGTEVRMSMLVVAAEVAARLEDVRAFISDATAQVRTLTADVPPAELPER